MRPLGEFLSKRLGFEIFAPLLPGHGTTPEDMARQKAETWLETVAEAYRSLSKQYNRVHVIGLSMGAVLSALLYEKKGIEPTTLTLLAPSVYLRKWLHRLTCAIFPWIPVPLWLGSIKKDEPGVAGQVAYSHYPIAATKQLFRVCRWARSLKLTCSIPTLIYYVREDVVVRPKSAHFLASRFFTPPERLIELLDPEHVLTLSGEAPRVFKEIGDFLESAAK